MRIYGVIPVKRFDHAKSRLGPALDAARRSALARALFEHVLTQTRATPEISGVVVATDCDDAAAFAARCGAGIVRDVGNPAGLGTVIDSALASIAATTDADAAIVVMADLPLLATGDVSAMCQLLYQSVMVIAPDHRDLGTNALALRLPAPRPTCFGNDDSFVQHCCAARRSGVDVAIHRSPGVALDIDVPHDLISLDPRVRRTLAA